MCNPYTGQLRTSYDVTLSRGLELTVVTDWRTSVSVAASAGGDHWVIWKDLEYVGYPYPQDPSAAARELAAEAWEDWSWRQHDFRLAGR